MLPINETSRIKFTKSEQNGELIGFVSRNSRTKLLRGVPENSPYGKRICVLSEELKGTVEPDVLYDVELVPMQSGGGYIVVSAEKTLFDAISETIVIPKTTYQIKITFGNKTIVFDPKDGKRRWPSSKTIPDVLKAIDERKDLRHKETVKNQFVIDAKALIKKMEQDGMLSARQLDLF